MKKHYLFALLPILMAGACSNAEQVFQCQNEEFLIETPACEERHGADRAFTAPEKPVEGLSTPEPEPTPPEEEEGAEEPTEEPREGY